MDLEGNAMAIYDQLLDICEERRGETLSGEEIKTILKRRFGTNPASVIPSDYCYNLWNKGASRKKPLFVKTHSGKYLCLGVDKPYTGVIEWRPKKTGQVQIIGEWVEGQRRLYSPDINPENPVRCSKPPEELKLSAEPTGKPVITRKPGQIDLLPNDNPWKKELKVILGFSQQLDGEIINELKRLSNSVYGEHILTDSRRILEVIIIELCEQQLNRERGTEPLKGIIDKLYKDKVIPLYIHTAMSVVNTFGTFGTHPKSFRPKQICSALNELSNVIEWFIAYKADTSH